MSNTIETNLYPQAAPATTLTNPLDQMTKAVSLGQGLAGIRASNNQNLAFQQQQAYQGAIGGVMQQSLGPDGQVDPGKFAIGVAANPATSRFAHDLIQQMIANGKVQADTMSTTLSNQATKLNNIATLTTPLTALGDDAKQGDVAKQVALGTGMGMVTPDEGQMFMKQLPSDQPVTDPQTGQSYNPLARYLSQFAMTSAQTAQRLRDIHGTLGLANTGGQQVPVATGQIPGVGPAAAAQQPLTNTLSPESLNQMVQVKQGDGSVVSRPRWMAAQTVDGQGNVTNPLSPAQVTVGNAPSVDAINEKYIPDLNDRIEQAPVQMKAIERQVDLLQYLQPDMSEPMRVNFAAAMKGSHLISPDVYNSILGGNPQAIAAAQELVKQQFMGATSQFLMSVGKGGVSQQQLDAYQKILPNLATDKVATANMLDYFHQLAQQPLKEQQVLKLYQDSGRPLSGYPAFLAKSMMRGGYARILNPGELSAWAQSQPSSQSIPVGGAGGVAHQGTGPTIAPAGVAPNGP